MPHVTRTLFCMATFRRLFIDHPASVDETYGEHFVAAMRYAGRMAVCAGAAAVHAVIPGLCCTTASERIHELDGEMQARRQVAEDNSELAVAS